LLFNSALEYAIRKVPETQVRLELKRTLLLLVYAADVNVPSDNINVIKRNIKSLIGTGKEVGLEADGVKTKYALVSRHQNAG
jgi:hypothetical protein